MSKDPTAAGKSIRSFYERGFLGNGPFYDGFLSVFPEEAQGVVDAVRDCPPLLIFLTEMIGSFPSTEEGWAGYRIWVNAPMGGVLVQKEDPEPDEREIERRVSESQKGVYRLVMAYRAAFAKAGIHETDIEAAQTEN